MKISNHYQDKNRAKDILSSISLLSASDRAILLGDIQLLQKDKDGDNIMQIGC